MNINRIMIAASKSGSGKTMITCALIQALKERELQVCSYKCGPDYIDPMFHKEVLGIPSRNLDTFFTGEQKTRELFFKHGNASDVVVMEGVMGLYDGLGGFREEGSSYHLAKVTKTPIVLVVDTKGMGYSVLPMIAGYLQYDKEHLIRGVLLNRTSQGMYEILAPRIETELGISVVGYFPNCKELHLESRHLGLVMPQEQEETKKQLQLAKEMFMQGVNLEKMLQLAAGAEELEDLGKEDVLSKMQSVECLQAPVIAVAMDEAFCFYYEDNLELLEEMGAKLQFFSPLHDQALPKECAGVLLGGGYPELYAKELSENQEMKQNIFDAFSKGMPMVAECGGFLYLHENIQTKEGNSYPMVGVLKGTCSDQGKLVRFGYIELQEEKDSKGREGWLQHGKIRAHEFHYYDSIENGSRCVAIKPTTGRTYPCILSKDGYWFGFPHLYYPSNPAFAKHFVEQANAFVQRRKTCFEEREEKEDGTIGAFF